MTSEQALDELARAIARQFNVHAMRGNTTDREIACVAITTLRDLGWCAPGEIPPWMEPVSIEVLDTVVIDNATHEELPFTAYRLVPTESETG